MSLHDLSQKELEKKIKEARLKVGITKIADGSGLYLTVRANGGMSWQLDYSMFGKRKTYSMGTYPNVTLSTARVLAQRAREKIQLGEDPVHARREERVSAVKVKTQSVEELSQLWLTRHKANWSERHLRDYSQALNHDVLPYIGPKPANLVTPEDIREILQRVEARGATYMVSRVRSVLNRVFEEAFDSGEFELNPVARVKRRGFAPHKEKHHDAIIRVEDLADLLKKLDADRALPAIQALKLAALVFVRHQNLRYGRWDEIDLDQGVWTLPAEQMKMKREFLVPLSRQAIELLRGMKTVTGSQPLIFPGYGGEPMSDFTMGKNLQRLGFKGRHTVHGFRTTAKTMLEEGGFDSKLTEKQLAHETKNKIEGAYNRAEYWEDRVTMMQAWADYLTGLAAGASVMSLRRSKRA